jgi:hypothetical protein
VCTSVSVACGDSPVVLRTSISRTQPAEQNVVSDVTASPGPSGRALESEGADTGA